LLNFNRALRPIQYSHALAIYANHYNYNYNYNLS